MTQDTRELVEKLRRSKGWPTLGNAAATALTAQAERITELEAENERLRVALSPFGDIADLFDCEIEGHSDTDELSLFYGDEADWLADRFTLAQFNAARAALAGKGWL